MLEKDIENLIAKYPQEFFPKETLTLKGQQFKIGSCYADIIFTDKFGRLIVIEIKRGVLAREATGQVFEYYGLLKEQYADKNIELILCANIIPREKRIFLEEQGIECKEIGTSLITEVAKKYNYRFLDEVKQIKEKDNQNFKKTTKSNTEKINFDSSVWIFQAVPKIFDTIGALKDPEYVLIFDGWVVRKHKNDIKIGDTVLVYVCGNSRGIYAIAEVTSNPNFLPINPKSYKYWKNREWIKDNQYFGVNFKIVKNLVNSPISEQQLKDIPGKTIFSSLLKGLKGTNFCVDQSEWEDIKKLLNKERR